MSLDRCSIGFPHLQTALFTDLDDAVVLKLHVLMFSTGAARAHCRFAHTAGFYCVELPVSQDSVNAFHPVYQGCMVA